MSQHRTCKIDGCKFTAHAKIVENHIKLQHVTGLYDKIRNISSPEDIAKWIEERKRKFPIRENVVKRQQEQEARLKKGIKIGRNQNKFGRDKYRCEYFTMVI